MEAAVADTSAPVGHFEASLLGGGIQAVHQFGHGWTPRPVNRQRERRAYRKRAAVLFKSDCDRPVAVTAHGLEAERFLPIRPAGQADMPFSKILTQMTQKALHAGSSPDT